MILLKEASVLLASAEAADSSLCLLGLAGRAEVVVAFEGFLGVLVTEEHLVLLDILDLGVL